MMLAHLTVVLSTVIGWSDPITVQPARGDRSLSTFQRSFTNANKPSERTLETLRRYDLERRYRNDPDGKLAALKHLAQSANDIDVVYAVAEVSWVEGHRLERWHKAAAFDRYLDTVAYAYDFLFDPALAAGRQPADPRFLLACQLYNDCLERIIRTAQESGKIMPEGAIRLKVRGKEQVLRVNLQNSPWKGSDVDQIMLASDFEVAGLENHSYLKGLGVPLIGIHKPGEAGKDGAEKFYPPEMAFPLTAFLRPTGRQQTRPGEGFEPRECTLELLDPIRDHRVGSQAFALSVEADFTTPLAYMWSRTDLNRYRFKGLLRPGTALDRANLIMLRPYEPGKIPVVMVHGLASSPLTWIPMLNELLRNQAINDHYQFMLYMYPTGVPVPMAAAHLRESLQLAQQMYDPDGTDQAFNKMVLLGHSMGGLLSHAMTVDSGEQFWLLNSDRAFDQITGKPDVLEELKRYLFFKPLPFVKRVVFLATPHRGSELSRKMIGRVSSGLIAEADEITSLLSQLVRANPDAFDARQFRRMPTSIDTLDPESGVLKALLAMQPGPGVVYNSIVGVNRPGPPANSTDGVVPYASAHLDGVESELRVRADHSVHKSPDAIREIARILQKHIGLPNAAPTAVIAEPAGPTVVR